MDSIDAVVAVCYLAVGAVVGVYATVRHFRDESDDWNLLVVFAIVLALGWPAVLYFLVKRRFFPKKVAQDIEKMTDQTKTLV